MQSRPQFGEAPPLPPPLQLEFREATAQNRGSERRDQRLLVAGVAAGGGITAAIAFLVVLLLLYRRLRATGRIRKTSPSEIVPNSANLRRFAYRDLKAATRSFNDAQKLGQGGFGAVYKGRLPHSGKEIAVKVLDTMSLQGEREFQNEVSVIGKVSSPHIVGLLGFCADRKRGRRLLVYEYMQNRSLQDALFDEGYGVQLGWGERFRIIMDTAKALAFLHGKCEPAIIHGDVKPSNILLDGNFGAKIADFGLARFKSDVAVAVAGGEGAEAELRAEREQRCWRRERRNQKQIREQNVVRTAKVENDGDLQVNEGDLKANADGDLKINADGDLKANADGDLKANADGDLKAVNGGDSKVNSDGDLKVVNGGGDSKVNADGDLKVVNGGGDSKANGGGDSKVNADGDSKVNEEGNSEANLDGDQQSVGTMQSPETFVSNSPMEENVIFMSSNAASPEPLNYDTDTVTETQEERTPSEIVDLEKNGNNISRIRDRIVECRSVDFCRDDDDKMSLSECFEKASLDSGRPGSSHHTGRRKKGKDWWRWQDSSGEFSVKDYVMEWIGTEIKKERPKSSWRADDEVQSERRDWNAESSSRNTNSGKKKHRRKEESVEWWASLAEENKESKKKEKTKSRGREWWREEYCEELSNKGRKLKSKGGGEWWNTEEEEMKKWWRSKSLSATRDWLYGDQPQTGNDCASGVSSTPSTRGTVCYIAPECGGAAGVVSEKSDVYSFGVVMLVVISGRRPLQVLASPITELERANLISWVRHLARAGKVLELVDGALGGGYDRDQALLCITVALLCLQRVPSARPSMGHVVQFLSGEVEAPPLPVEFSPSPPYGVPFRPRRRSTSSRPRRPPS